MFPYEGMKERMERLVVLPFSTGCSSQASVAVGKSPPRKPKSESTQNLTSNQVGEECSSTVKTKNSFGWLPLPKPNISSGIHRLIRNTVKSFSQLFGKFDNYFSLPITWMYMYYTVYKEIEEVTAEMEIGFPTDVKHVSHIGLDGNTTTNPLKGWEDFNPPDIIAFPSISLRQFELGMAAQIQNRPLIV